MKWVSIDKKLPLIRERVLLKRDFSSGAGGGMRELEWLSEGMYTISSFGTKKVQWHVTNTKGLTYNNSTPTHWKYK